MNNYFGVFFGGPKINAYCEGNFSKHSFISESNHLI